MIVLLIRLGLATLDLAREQREHAATRERLREAHAAIGEARLDLLRQKTRAERAEDEARRWRERARGAS